jgi:hypothetical protein
MHMPKARGYRYIVAARDDLTGACEARALKSAASQPVAEFLWEEIICRYGFIGQIVTDNGSETKGFFQELVKKYDIPHIRISPYNSKANGVVERGHFTLREALIKACKGNIAKWPELLRHAVFADRITIRKSTGFSAHYLLYGVHPVLPFDLTEATYLVQGFRSGLTSEELLALRIQQLEKHGKNVARAAKVLKDTRMWSKRQFEKRFAHRLKQKEFSPGDLVLVRNSTVEKELNRKTKPRYIGPYEVVKRTDQGSYVLKELDGAQSRTRIAGFRLLRYHPATRNLAELVRDPIQRLGDRIYAEEEGQDGVIPQLDQPVDVEEEEESAKEADDQEDQEAELSEEDESDITSDIEEDVPVSQRTRSRRR